MYMICLDNSNNVLGIYLVSTGGYTATLVDVKAIMLVAINTCCTGVIIAHNHPSGSIHPSSSDKYITTKVNSALNMVDIKLLDHMIITDDAYYSFADENIL
jgi:DNA repair protein RadC